MGTRGTVDRLALPALLLVVAIVYAGAAGAPFYWDDHPLILENPTVLGGDVAAAFFGDLWGRGTPYWRPLTLLGFMVDHRLFGDSPAGYHLHSLAWHLAATTALWALVRPRLGPARAFVAVAIFALHPIQSEAVLWIAARNDSMCTTGLLAALAFADRPGPAARVGLVAAALVAAMSKELGMLLPFFLVGWRLAWGERPRTGELALAGAVCLGALGARAVAVETAGWGEALPWSLLEILPQAAVLPLSWFTVPWPLTGAESLFSRVAPLSWAGAVASAAIVAAVLVRAGRRGAVLLGMAALAWAPAIGAVGGSALVGERYLYLPLAFTAVAVAVAAPSGRAFVITGLAAGMVAILGVTLRVAEWTSEGALLRAAISRSDNGYAHWRYGIHLRQVDHAEAAFDELLRAERAWRPIPRAGIVAIEYMLRDGRYADAASLSDELSATRSDMAIFRTRRLRALVLAGRIHDARGYLGELRAQKKKMAAEDYAPKGALCLAEGDVTCAMETWLRSPAPEVWQVDVHDLLHPPGPPARPGGWEDTDAPPDGVSG